jgi:hypothetical protein
MSAILTPAEARSSAVSFPTLSEMIPPAARVALACLFVLSGVFLAATLQWEAVAEFSSFAFALGKLSIALSSFLLADRYILHFDTMKEVRSGNVAVALVASVVFAGIVVLVAVC